MYKRIVLKLSGEALAGSRGFGLDADKIAGITGEIADVHALGVEIGIVVGGGNFFRGVAEQAIHMDRVAADHMGMLATMINALALTDIFESEGITTRCLSSIFADQVAEPFVYRLAEKHLDKGRVVIAAGGIGRSTAQRPARNRFVARPQRRLLRSEGQSRSPDHPLLCPPASPGTSSLRLR